MGHKITFAYDEQGNLSDVTDPDNGVTHYDYDDDGRMTGVTNPFSEATAYEYSPGGRVEKRVLHNGCVTYYSYDAIGQVSKVDNRQGDLSVISSFEYERDPRGNPTKIVREDGYTTYYEYDAKSQLTRETHRESGGQTVYAWEWDYDSCGNRSYQIFNGAQTDYTYNLANQLTEETSGGVTTYYKYDRSGNTISKKEVAGATYYHWDHGNHLTQIDQPGNVHSYFTYDGDGKRKTKQDAEGFTRFVYQGPDMLGLLQERDADDELVAQYTMGNGLEAMRRGGESRFYHYDWLGSTFELTDEEGAVTDEYLYDAWGNALAATGGTVNPHRYVGRQRYYRVAPGAYHVGYRELDSALGRFLSADPSLPSRDYMYCEGDPIAWIDTEGLTMAHPDTRRGVPGATMAGMAGAGVAAGARVISLAEYLGPEAMAAAAAIVTLAALQNMHLDLAEETRELLHYLGPEGPGPRKVLDWLKIAKGAITGTVIATAAKTITDTIRQNPRKLCKARHPSWPWCGPWTTKGAAAIDLFQLDCNKPTDPARWKQPYNPQLYSKPNLPNRSKWAPLKVLGCKQKGAQASSLTKRNVYEIYICNVSYISISDPHYLRTEEALEQTILHEQCCHLFSEAWHFQRIHHSGGPPKRQIWY